MKDCTEHSDSLQAIPPKRPSLCRAPPYLPITKPPNPAQQFTASSSRVQQPSSILSRAGPKPSPIYEPSSVPSKAPQSMPKQSNIVKNSPFLLADQASSKNIVPVPPFPIHLTQHLIQHDHHNHNDYHNISAYGRCERNNDEMNSASAHLSCKSPIDFLSQCSQSTTIADKSCVENVKCTSRSLRKSQESCGTNNLQLATKAFKQLQDQHPENFDSLCPLNHSGNVEQHLCKEPYQLLLKKDERLTKPDKQPSLPANGMSYSSKPIRCKGYPRTGHIAHKSPNSSGVVGECQHCLDDCQCEACQSTHHSVRCCIHEDHKAVPHHHRTSRRQTKVQDMPEVESPRASTPQHVTRKESYGTPLDLRRQTTSVSIAAPKPLRTLHSLPWMRDKYFRSARVIMTESSSQETNVAPETKSNCTRPQGPASSDQITNGETQ